MRAEMMSARFVEVPAKDHWWEDMLKHPEVVAFIRKFAKEGKRDWAEERQEGFTLTCASPDECGGRAGIRITELITPGR